MPKNTVSSHTKSVGERRTRTRSTDKIEFLAVDFRTPDCDANDRERIRQQAKGRAYRRIFQQIIGCEKLLDIVIRRATGVTCRQLAQEHNCHPSTISRIEKRMHCKLKNALRHIYRKRKEPRNNNLPDWH